jgi:hypothetical protein
MWHYVYSGPRRRNTYDSSVYSSTTLDVLYNNYQQIDAFYCQTIGKIFKVNDFCS